MNSGRRRKLGLLVLEQARERRAHSSGAGGVVSRLSAPPVPTFFRGSSASQGPAMSPWLPPNVSGHAVAQ